MYRVLANAQKMSSFQRSFLTQPFLRTTQRSFSNESFLSGGSANYIDHMHEQWQKDPSSVHASWHAYFSGASFEAPPTLGKAPGQGQLDEILSLLKSGGGSGGVSSVAAERAAKESVQLAALLNAFETVGHLVADLDPLKIQEVYKDNDNLMGKFKVADQHLRDRLDYKHYGFTEADLDREFNIELPHASSILQQKRVWKLRDVIEAYKTAYCGKVGVEFSHIPDKDIQDWIRVNFEGIQFNRMNDKEKLHLYDRLNWAHDFGTFLT
jgi:2-oxoglutarate dehydrogenase E1 component